MKKETSRRRNAVKASGQIGPFAVKGIKGPLTRGAANSRRAANRSTSAAAKSINAANYAKVMSYIVRTEEDETRMMIAASDSMVSQ